MGTQFLFGVNEEFLRMDSGEWHDIGNITKLYT